MGVRLLTFWGAVMPTRYNHFTIGSAVRSALGQTVILERMAVVDLRANQQTYDKLGIRDIDVVRWKGPALVSRRTRAWTMSSRDTSTMLDGEYTLLPDTMYTMRRLAGAGPSIVSKVHEGRLEY